MYDKILVPHEGTPAGDVALNHAIQIAKSHSSEIILLHVIEDFPHAPVFVLHASQAAKLKKEVAQITKEMKAVMEKSLQKQVKLCNKNGIDCKLKVVSGLPTDEILKVVKNQKIDLIVMAKRKKLKGIKSLLSLGSVSRKVVENTPCPALLIGIEKK